MSAASARHFAMVSARDSDRVQSDAREHQRVVGGARG